MWLCDSTLGRNGWVMKIFWVLGCFRKKYWEVILVKKEWPRGGEKLEFWEYFQSCLKVVWMWQCDSTLDRDCGAVEMFWVLGVLERSFEKWFWWKMNDRGVGRNFNYGNIFEVAWRWWECDYVTVLWVLMVELWRPMEFWGVLEKSIEKWFWWKMNDRGVGRNFNLGNILKVVLRWWESDYVIVFWLLIVELWRCFEFWVF